MTRYSKLWAALVGAGVVALVQFDVIQPSMEEPVITTVLSLLTAAGVYAVPNA